jgi:membrane protease YdiL (CAAX protease family)
MNPESANRMTVSIKEMFNPAGCALGGIDVFLFLSLCIISFIVYWFTVESRSLKDRFTGRWGSEKGSLYFFIFNKLWGAFWFGLLCTLGAKLLFPDFRLSDFGLAFPAAGLPARNTLLWLGGLLPVMVLAGWAGNRKTARRGGDFGRYPEIEVKSWTGRILLIHVGFWALYLFAYELMFRGTLLFTLAAAIGPWPAVGVNVALYSAVHVPKGRQEAVGALPLGLLLCLITLSTGSIAAAFLAHLAIAVSNGLSAFYYRSDMGWRR